MQRKHNRPSGIDIRLPAGTGPRFRAELNALLEDYGEESFALSYLRKEIFTKYCDATTTPADVRRQGAIQKWMAAESRNRATNERLLLASLMETDFGWTTWDKFRHHCRKFIRHVLGPLEYPGILQNSTHTNGASPRVKRSPIASLHKLAGEGLVSSAAVQHWVASTIGTTLISQPWHVHETSTLFTVPKRSDIDRVACKEPEINMLMQRSVGNHIRARLRRFGVDLSDQSRNQELARIAVEQKLATIDLSSASDTISRQLVFELLPFEWWSLLDDLRVHSTLIDGQVHFLEMFSSMGNGFTFELESLLFYALTRTACYLSGIKGRISVYGDDIIAPSAIVRRLKRLFNFVGFEINSKKTHFRGPFRESCGRHYWNGRDVTPFYIRREVDTLPDLINHLNAILDWDGRGWGFFSNEKAFKFWKRWRSLVPQAFWGGIDPRDPSALVTGHRPRKRLVPRTRKIQFDAQAGLTYWHLTRRLTEEPFSVDPHIEVGFRSSPFVSCGERTTWDPELLFRS